MRISYWSNSKFAAKLREVFGLPKQPTSATWEEWKEIEAEEKKASRLGIAIIHGFDKIQGAIYAVPDALHSVAYFAGNIKNQSNVLRTRTKFGSWADLSNRIPDGLMFAVVDYFEKECFWMNCAFTSKEEMHTLEPEVQKYIQQSYIHRKLFGVKVSDEVRAKHAREWIDFQIKEGNPESASGYEALWAAYKFAKGRYLTYDAWEESGYNARMDEIHRGIGNVSEEQTALFRKITELEEAFEKEVEIHCTSIVKYRQFMWT
jgi:hypothetical protein